MTRSAVGATRQLGRRVVEQRPTVARGEHRPDPERDRGPRVGAIDDRRPRAGEVEGDVSAGGRLVAQPPARHRLRERALEAADRRDVADGLARAGGRVGSVGSTGRSVRAGHADRSVRAGHAGRSGPAGHADRSGPAAVRSSPSRRSSSRAPRTGSRRGARRRPGPAPARGARRAARQSCAGRRGRRSAAP